MKTNVVNIRTDKYEVYIGRAGKGKDGYFGNPFHLEDEEDRERILVLYKDYFNIRIEEDEEFKNKVEGLKGKTLGCFCKPKLCHGDIIVEYLESEN